MGIFGGGRGKSRFVESEHGVYKAVKNRRFAYGGAPERDLRSAHMSVSGGAAAKIERGDSRSLDSRIDRYYDERGRFVKKRSCVNPLMVITRHGLRRDVAWTAIILTVVLMSGTLIYVRTGMDAQEKKLSTLRTSVARCVEKNDTLRAQVEAATSEMNIAYKAKDLGLVSSKSLPVTRLYAPLNAQISPAERELVLPADTLATIFGNE